MRFLIHGLNYAPELTGIGKYSGEMAKWLAEQGHDVRVVCAPPYYPEWKAHDGYYAHQYRREWIDGVQVWRCPTWIPRRPSGLKRLLHLASFALSSFPVMLMQVAWRPDVVIVIEPPLFCAPQALLTARLSRAIAWLHVQDFEIDAAFSLGILPSTPINHLIFRLESTILRSFDKASSISTNMKSKLEEKGLPPSKAVLFPNWVGIEEIYPDKDSAISLKRELGISPEKLIVLYSGNLGEKQGIDMLIEAARQLQDDPSLEFVICGDGAAKTRLVNLAEGLDNVRFGPLQPADRFNSLLNMADIHVLPQQAQAADLVLPSKLTGILAVGGAVIATASSNTELASVVTQAGGSTVPPGDASALADQIRQFSSDPKRRTEAGRRARAYAEQHLGRQQILKKFLKVLDAPPTPEHL